MHIEEWLNKMPWKKPDNTAVGLDIGKDAIKLVEIRREGEEIRLSKIDFAKIPAAGESNQAQSQIIRRAVAAILARNRIEGKNIVLSVKGQFVFIKFLEILPVTADKLEKTIRYEAQQQIPFPLEEVEWDTYLLDRINQEKPSAYRVLLAAIKKDKLADKVDALEKENVRPAILDVNSLSIYNCLKYNQDYDKNQLTCAIDIGAQATDLLILQGDNFWMRSLALGGDNLTDALAKKLNLKAADADKLKAKMNLASPDIKETLGPILEELKSEISRSIDYYYFQKKEGKGQVGEIILSGGGALFAGLDKFLAESFSCRVRPIEPFKRIKLDQEAKSELVLKDKTLFSAALGLALRGISEAGVNINLLKQRAKSKNLAYQRMAFSAGSVILALLILFGASTFMGRDYRSRSARLKHLKGLLNTFNEYRPKIKEIEQKAQLVSGQTKALHNLARNRGLWLEVVCELQKMLGDNLWITEFDSSISFDGNFVNKLDLEGKAISYNDVNNFVARLKSSTLFKEVKPISSAFVEEITKDKAKTELVKFSIGMNINLISTPEVEIGGGGSR